MAEYLTPGVYLEETSFRSRSIEGVPTSTFGMAGLTRYGPVPFQLPAPRVTMIDKPLLVTSFTEFERAFGGLEDVGIGEDPRNYLAYAARAFFDNGGRRLYVSRVFPFATVTDAAGNTSIDVDANFAKLDLTGTPALASWRARWPGAAGSAISVQVGFRRSKNLLVGNQLRGLSPGCRRRDLRRPGRAAEGDRAADARPSWRTSGSSWPARAARSSCARTTAAPSRCRSARPCATSRSTSRWPWATSAWTPTPGSSWTPCTPAGSAGCCRPSSRPTRSAWSGSTWPGPTPTARPRRRRRPRSCSTRSSR